jgi:hypothetical protein
MTDVWQQSEKSFKYFIVYEKKRFWVFTFFFSIFVNIRSAINIGKKKEDKHEDGEKRV